MTVGCVGMFVQHPNEPQTWLFAGMSVIYVGVTIKPEKKRTQDDSENVDW